jgi:hypothetical protein
MSAQAQADQVEAQAAQVEQEYRREEKRESKAMDSKLLALKRVSAQKKKIVNTLVSTIYPLIYHHHSCVYLILVFKVSRMLTLQSFKPS